MGREAVVEARRSVADLSEALRAAFACGEVGDAFTEDVFLDGHPPFWRFQLEGREALTSWLRDYTRHAPRVETIRTVMTASGFVAEQSAEEDTEQGTVTSRKILLCETRDDRICAMTVYCSGDWDAGLRARHAAEARIVRA